MSLSQYKKKRSFENTPEPTGDGKRKKGKQLVFVVQKHHASRLHYDFRLEMDGVLKSWAVPKGPSLNPSDKRLAMEVEDHPFGYKDFEGIIPKGNYGAGTVIVWDNGTYEPSEPATGKDPEKQLLHDWHAGTLSIRLHGKKLNGDYALVKTRGREENAWLLIKKKDRYAKDTDITKKEKSVLSDKTLAEVKENKEAKRWISNRKANGKLKEERGRINEEASPSSASEYSKKVKSLLKDLPGKRKAPVPKNIRPMLATLVDEPFQADGWSYEIKWDGYRALAWVDGKKPDLRSRNDNSYADRFYPVFDALKKWPVKAVVDGEIVVVNEKGITSFQQLQNWRSEPNGELIFYVFDILWLDGYDVTGAPLSERRRLLKPLVPAEGIIRFSDNFETNAVEFLNAAAKLGIEGIIAKKNDSEYAINTRSKDWLKIKTGKRHEAVIGGYTINRDSSKLFSSLLLGVYENKKLKFMGQVGTGYTHPIQKEILKKLKPLEIPDCPFEHSPGVNKPAFFRPASPKAAVVWVKPQLVAEVQYQELTTEGIMRHPSFQGLRTDKKAKDVEMDKPVAVPLQTIPIATGAKKTAEKKSRPGTAREDHKLWIGTDAKQQSKKVNGHELIFTNPDKLYWPKEKITKGDLINYYHEVAPYILPYMKDRPQSLNRFPGGINGPGFYQKNVAGKIPSWLTTHNYKNTSKEGTKRFLVCTDEASLLYMANLGCIEMNPWHSRIRSPDNPDWCVIDLDPDTNSFEQVMEAANVIKKILDALGVSAYPKTSGSTGIHIYIPLGAKYEYEQSKMLAELIVSIAHREMTGFTSLERNPSKRKGKIYLDFLQNRPIQTIAAPYSLRPKPGATVSAPLHWEEVKEGLSMKDFTIHNMIARIKEQGDIFRNVLGKGIDLHKVIKKAAAVFE